MGNSSDRSLKNQPSICLSTNVTAYPNTPSTPINKLSKFD